MSKRKNNGANTLLWTAAIAGVAAVTVIVVGKIFQ